ncbi:hypothetical protein NLJ89_g10548 [Agrocybe chaxingu]|uniref:Uncharacterized protein n=1 Tax=Agrocybe chaxingu TaxID=84603 RepID=A0A9W8JQJ0_9AGAR|nr:hypothetical protein NLJ89_g10548 [Agrocybe chaxingu]
MAPSHSEDAVFSGYLMSVDDFKNFFVTIKPSLAERSFEDYIFGYDAWKFRLSKADRARAPRLRLVPLPDIPAFSLPTEDTIDKVFLPTRYVRYTSKKQLRRNEKNRHLWEENEKDRAKLEEFCHFIASLGGNLDVTRVAGFGCLKDVHPYFTPGL